MENKNFNNMEIRKDTLKSDNSQYFSSWGSRNPEITINEEIDNQIAANPTFAGIDIISSPSCRCTIRTFNDGNTPTLERMEKMKCIGKTFSDRNGASICGVGQIHGLVSGRKSPQSTGTLTFKSVHNGLVSHFTCRANGKDFTINTENTGPFTTDETNIVEKNYEGMRDFDECEIEKVKILAAVKVFPYSKIYPKFVYSVNGEKITPFDILYPNINDIRIKRMPVKEYIVQYHNEKYTINAAAVDVARYVKPDGFHLIETHADALDRYYQMSPNSGGVFVEVGGVNVITGGKESWNFINRNYHSTHNGQRVWISIPSKGELKDAIFAESPNKSSINICLNEIQDYDGRFVFKQIIEEINANLNLWTEEREIVNTNGKLVKKEKENEMLTSIFNNTNFSLRLKNALNELSEEEILILGNKKFKTVIDCVNK